MKRAVLIAKKALAKGQLPIGAILINKNFEIAIGINIKTHPFFHAEINAIKQSFFYTSKKSIKNNTLYITLEPCFLCLSSIFYAKIEKIFFSTYYTDEIKKHIKIKLTHNKNIKNGILKNESKIIIKNIFQKKKTIKNKHCLLYHAGLRLL